ncbi:hypothetical protein RG903_05620 [Thermithiobacillus tepidarius DSM 3134]|uniref:hypothetical protein n=1 Tax=Thermithiobacillus tepidarius TaxID=929 RepID=UPI001E3AAFD2|nr:hypothetical protein [Thermithiobacillus tepidarius]
MNTAAGCLRAQIQELRFLPPLPAAAPAILRVFADEEADIEAVERAVALEPGLAARLSDWPTPPITAIRAGFLPSAPPSSRPWG